nr:helix-turn-helix transcriptional regulator [uncultured Oscillibacter sp.]
MDWGAIGKRIRKQREFLGYTREQLSELLDVTPKFCSDIELGVKGMSVPTLCRIAEVLHLSTDYILFGTEPNEECASISQMLKKCSPRELHYAESILKTFLMAINEKGDQPTS